MGMHTREGDTRHHPMRETQRIVEDESPPLAQGIREGFLEKVAVGWVWKDE